MADMQLYNPSESVQSICTFNATTAVEQANMYNMISNPDKRLADCIGETINVTDSYVEIVTMTDELTGEQNKAPRVILIDDKGVSYACVSSGIYNSMTRLYSLFGMQTWEPAIPLTVKQVTKGKNKILTLIIDSKSFQG